MDTKKGLHKRKVRRDLGWFRDSMKKWQKEKKEQHISSIDRKKNSKVRQSRTKGGVGT